MKLHHIDPRLLLNQAISNQTPKKLDKNNPEDVRKVCQEFESLFIQALFKGMRSTIPDGGLLEKGMDTEIFTELMDHEIARKMSKKQELGIADILFKQLFQPQNSSE